MKDELFEPALAGNSLQNRGVKAEVANNDGIESTRRVTAGQCRNVVHALWMGVEGEEKQAVSNQQSAFSFF